MAIIDKIQSRLSGKTSDATPGASTGPGSEATTTVNAGDGSEEIQHVTQPNAISTIDSELAQKDLLPTEDAQRGVQKIEAVTLAWSKKSLATVLILYISPVTCLPHVPLLEH